MVAMIYFDVNEKYIPDKPINPIINTIIPTALIFAENIDNTFAT